MITEKIKNLFQFIGFLHSNTENFKQYDIVIDELSNLQIKKSSLSRQNNYKDKIKIDELEKEIVLKRGIIYVNITQLIVSKVNELNICDWHRIETLWNYNIEEILNIKRDFDKNDIPEIFEYKKKYLEFRTKTNCVYFQPFFFSALDEILKELFDFFKETTVDEFIFETKPIVPANVFEAVSLVHQQTETVDPNEGKKELHNHIFNENAFEFWESLFENFNINETKRTDLRFMYEIMKYKGQIHKTVTVKIITDWINDTYQFSIVKLYYTDINSKSNENRMSIYNLIK